VKRNIYILLILIIIIGGSMSEKKKEGIKVKCPYCGYEWVTKSDHVYVSCPSCLKKVKIRDVKGVK